MKKILVFVSLIFILASCANPDTQQALANFELMEFYLESGYSIEVNSVADDLYLEVYQIDDSIYYDMDYEDYKIKLRCNIDDETYIKFNDDGERYTLKGSDAEEYCEEDSEIYEYIDEMFDVFFSDEMKAALRSAEVSKDNEYYIFKENKLSKIIGESDVENLEVKISIEPGEFSARYREVDTKEDTYIIIKTKDIEFPNN